MLKIKQDHAYREIEVELFDDDGNGILIGTMAREFAEQHLCNEGADRDWDFDGIERVNLQRVVVKFVGW